MLPTWSCQVIPYYVLYELSTHASPDLSLNWSFRLSKITSGSPSNSWQVLNWEAYEQINLAQFMNDALWGINTICPIILCLVSLWETVWYMTNWECDWIVWSRNWQSFPICLFLTYFEKLTKYIYSLIRALLIFRPMRLWGLKAWQNFSPVLWVFFGKRDSVGKRITGSIESLCHKKWAALFQRATERQGNFWLPIFSTLDALFLDSSFFTFLRSWTKSLAESSSALGRWTRCDGSPTLSQTTWLRQSGPIS